ncbi:hypothetical protein GGR22_001173 [Flavobacterium gossypii]|uniref:Uncharacterized protein n=1 Tax=Flavobacterium gossypii TaxID=1646119 RepID=A0ABR6DMX6_9FLAO|nr:hypothetical protein [Flavobacterium gossypii]
MALETDMAIVCSVAVNLYHTSCEAFGAQVGAAPLIVIPLNVPLMLVQLALGVNCIALEHSSLA